VLDELCDPGWGVSADDLNSFQTADPEEFLEVYWQSRQCIAFMDESGDAIGHYDKAMIKTATRGRHWGHVNHYLVQRGAMISPTVRAQCTKIFCFNQSEDDAKTLAREWNKPELLKAPDLAQGEYIFAQKMGKVSVHKHSEDSSNAAVSNRVGSGESGGGPAVAQGEEGDASGDDDDDDSSSGRAAE